MIICGGDSMKRMNRTGLLSLFILLISFIIIRYALFEIHGMKQIPLILFLPIFLAMIIFCFTKLKIIPFVFAVSYPIGFVLGNIFQTYGIDAGGGATSNMWIIWTSVIIAMIIISVITELINRNKSKN